MLPYSPVFTYFPNAMQASLAGLTRSRRLNRGVKSERVRLLCNGDFRYVPDG